MALELVVHPHKGGIDVLLGNRSYGTGSSVFLSAPVIKCKKTPREKCRIVAERKKKDRLPIGRKERAERESGNERRSMDGHTK